MPPSTLSVAPPVETRTRFYVRMAVLMAVLGFAGFLPTFWMPITRGAYTSPVITVHALAGSMWLLLFLAQSWLAASGRIVRHRDFGLLGVSLATLVVIFGVMAAIDQTQRAAAAGRCRSSGRAARRRGALLVADGARLAHATSRAPGLRRRLCRDLLNENAETARQPDGGLALDRRVDSVVGGIASAALIREDRNARPNEAFRGALAICLLPGTHRLDLQL